MAAGGPVGNGERAVKGVDRRRRCSTLRAWIASSFTSTSCRASTTARPISGSRSRSPARPCATGRGLVTCTPHASFVDVAEVPERVRELRAALVAGGHRPRGPPRRRARVGRRARARRRPARDGRPGPARPALGAARGAAAGHRHARRPARQRAGAARARLRGAHRPSRALARARARRPAPSRRLLAAGDRLQVNASSLTGYHGAGARAAALELVERRPRGGHRLRRPSAPAIAPRA